MLDPVHHIEYIFEKGKGWLPVVIREAQLRQAAKMMNFGSPAITYGNIIVNYRTIMYGDDI